jgi:23S rRNA pseudouridine1911/1915/1917 synthase
VTGPEPGAEEIEVPGALDGVRLDRAVSMLTGVTRAQAADLVGNGAVRMAGRVCGDGARRLRRGDRVAIDPAALGALSVHEQPPGATGPVPFAVVFEDADIIVVDKPAGVVVHPGAGNRTGTLAAGLLEAYPELAELPRRGAGTLDRPGIVHRLDKETSGLLVVARTAEAFPSLVDQLARRAMRRRYLALAVGHLEASSGTIDAPIARSVRDRTRMAVLAGGKEARTSYEVRGRYGVPLPVSELQVSLETGRTHQIRVHLAAIGHPVLGDRRYGGTRGTLGVKRPMLHAWRLDLDHPRTRARLSFEAAPPADYREVLALLA